jgi:hypothetical protein
MMKYIFLFLPCLIALATPFYNSVEPSFAGIPFFYWFQLVLIPISAVCIFVADRIGGTRS